MKRLALFLVLFSTSAFAETAFVLTAWVGDGLTIETAYSPAVTADYGPCTYSDVTGQPGPNLSPDPNLFVVRLDCDLAIIDQIDVDAAYFVVRRETRVGVPSEEEFERLRVYLGANADAAIGPNLNGRTRTVIEDDLREWLKVRPKMP